MVVRNKAFIWPMYLWDLWLLFFKCFVHFTDIYICIYNFSNIQCNKEFRHTINLLVWLRICQDCFVNTETGVFYLLQADVFQQLCSAQEHGRGISHIFAWNFGFSVFLIFSLRTIFYYYCCIQGSAKLYKNMLRGVLNTQLYFFSKNPIGKI